VGRQAFWRHDFLVTPAVLIPCFETELLVETGLELLREERPVVVDVGTGSGCIALSIAAEREDAEVHATDISEPVFEVARENARRLGLEGRVTFHKSDLLEPLTGLEVDLVVSNPPYVDRAHRAGLAPRCGRSSPGLHPPDGVLEMYRRPPRPQAAPGRLAGCRAGPGR
jgi:release factor glutamine methyltransferase